jgi:UDP-N-acetylmuramate--alanine ligase
MTGPTPGGDPAAAPPAVDLRTPGRFHVVGIGGSGMCAIAEVLVAMGHDFSGSDLKDSPTLDRLRAMAVTVSVGHDARNVGTVDAVTVSTAIGGDNPEVVAARAAGIPVLRRAEILAAITATRRTVAVAGTHGKTTTASMLAVALRGAGLSPSFLIGGDVNEVGSGAVWDRGDLLVVEADESDGTFLELHAEAGLLTSAEPDHLEHYGGVDALLAAFHTFVARCGGPVVVCADDDGARAIASATGSATYGLHPDADVRAGDLVPGAHGTTFSVFLHGEAVIEVHLPVPGVHNVQNAVGALAMAHTLGADLSRAAEAVGRFAGVARRFQHRGTTAGVTFVDDYAHLPTEVRVAIEAAAQGRYRRVVCVFQPHRYSRTEAVGRDFAHAFDGADLLAVTDVFAAGEAPRPGVSGRLVLDAVLEARPWRPVAYLPRRADQVAWLAAVLRPGDLCLTLGAGDLTSLPDEIQEQLR